MNEEDDVALGKKNGLIILVEIGVFVLRRKKMGQWVGINNYNKAPQVPKDENFFFEIMLGNGLSMMLESELLFIGLVINFLDNGEDQLLVIIFWTNYKSQE